MPNSKQQPTLLLVLVLLAGVIGGVILVVCVIIFCKYCLKQTHRNRKKNHSFRSGLRGSSLMIRDLDSIDSKSDEHEFNNSDASQRKVLLHNCDRKEESPIFANLIEQGEESDCISPSASLKHEQVDATLSELCIKKCTKILKNSAEVLASTSPRNINLFDCDVEQGDFTSQETKTIFDSNAIGSGGSEKREVPRFVFELENQSSKSDSFFYCQKMPPSREKGAISSHSLQVVELHNIRRHSDDYLRRNDLTGNIGLTPSVQYHVSDSACLHENDRGRFMSTNKRGYQVSRANSELLRYNSHGQHMIGHFVIDNQQSQEQQQFQAAPVHQQVHQSKKMQQAQLQTQQSQPSAVYNAYLHYHKLAPPASNSCVQSTQAIQTAVGQKRLVVDVAATGLQRRSVLHHLGGDAGDAKHSLSLETGTRYFTSRSLRTDDRKVHSCDSPMSCSSHRFEPLSSATKHFKQPYITRSNATDNFDDDLTRISPGSKVRYNDMGSLESVNENQQMLDELILADDKCSKSIDKSISPTVRLHDRVSCVQDAVNGEAAEFTLISSDDSFAEQQQKQQQQQQQNTHFCEMWQLRTALEREMKLDSLDLSPCDSSPDTSPPSGCFVSATISNKQQNTNQCSNALINDMIISTAHAPDIFIMGNSKIGQSAFTSKSIELRKSGDEFRRSHETVESAEKNFQTRSSPMRYTHGDNAQSRDDSRNNRTCDLSHLYSSQLNAPTQRRQYFTFDESILATKSTTCNSNTVVSSTNKKAYPPAQLEHSRQAPPTSLHRIHIPRANSYSPKSNRSPLASPEMKRGNFLQPPLSFEARRQNFRNALQRRNQKLNTSGDTSLDSLETMDTDPEISDHSRGGHTTTSFESTTDNTDSTGDSHTCKLQQMQRDSGYKSLENPTNAVLVVSSSHNQMAVIKPCVEETKKCDTPSLYVIETGVHNKLLPGSDSLDNTEEIAIDQAHSLGDNVPKLSVNLTSATPALLVTHEYSQVDLEAERECAAAELSKAVEAAQLSAAATAAASAASERIRKAKSASIRRRQFSSDRGKVFNTYAVLHHQEHSVPEVERNVEKGNFSLSGWNTASLERSTTSDSFDDTCVSSGNTMFKRFFKNRNSNSNENTTTSSVAGNQSLLIDALAIMARVISTQQRGVASSPSSSPTKKLHSYNARHQLSRDFSIDEKTNAIFNDFMKQDPRFDKQAMDARVLQNIQPKQRLPHRRHDSEFKDYRPYQHYHHYADRAYRSLNHDNARSRNYTTLRNCGQADSIEEEEDWDNCCATSDTLNNVCSENEDGCAHTIHITSKRPHVTLETSTTSSGSLSAAGISGCDAVASIIVCTTSGSSSSVSGLC